MNFYSLADRLAPRSYGLKLFAAAFIGAHLPLIAGVAMLALSSGPVDPVALAGVLLAATLAGTGLALASLRMLLSPILATEKALARYEADRIVPELPEHHRDEAGRLMAATSRLLRQAEQALTAAEKAAFTDPLTGAFNRRGFERMIPRDCAGAFLMVDIDRFKSINDTLGHDAGDRVLTATARAISGAVRRGDVPARLGGEEFAVFLPDADLMTAMEVGERVRAAVQAGVRAGDRSVTVSVGAAAGGAGASALAATMKGADAALYAAKRAGRNRVTPYLPRPALPVPAARARRESADKR